jgi:hypothetical protein
MSRWKKVALVNVGGLLGIGLSLFIVPPQTPLWIWATLSVLCLAVFNCFLFRRLRRSTSERKADSKSGVVIWLAFVLLVLELVFRYWHR